MYSIHGVDVQPSLIRVLLGRVPASLSPVRMGYFTVYWYVRITALKIKLYVKIMMTLTLEIYLSIRLSV